MNFNKVYKAKDLQALGSVEEITRSLNEAMTPFKVDPDIDTYEDLLPYVIRAKKIELYEPGSFFISKKHEYIYYLTQHQKGEEKLQKLGCEERFFENAHRKDAKKWFYKIAHILRANSDSNTIEDDITKIAFQRLEGIMKIIGLEFDDAHQSNKEASL